MGRNLKPHFYNLIIQFPSNPATYLPKLGKPFVFYLFSSSVIVGFACPLFLVQVLFFFLYPWKAQPMNVSVSGRWVMGNYHLLYLHDFDFGYIYIYVYFWFFFFDWVQMQ